MRTYHHSYLWLMLLPLVLWQCKTGTANQPIVTTTKPRPVARPVVALGGCIRGQLTDEEGKPVSFAEVRTEPPTDLRTANKQGQFEICFKRVRSTDNPNRSERATLDLGQYKLFATKDNSKSAPLTFAYNGKEVELGQIRMNSKSFLLRDGVQSGKPKERKVDGGGITGTPPKEE